MLAEHYLNPHGNLHRHHRYLQSKMKSTLVAICFLLAVVHTMVEVVGGSVDFDIHSTGGGIGGHNQGPQTVVEDTGDSGQAGPPAPPGGGLPGLSGQAGAPSPGR